MESSPTPEAVLREVPPCRPRPEGDATPSTLPTGRKGGPLRTGVVAVLLFLCFAATPAVAGEEPVVDATPEAKALVSRFREQVFGPAPSGDPVETDLIAVIGGKNGAAAVQAPLHLRARVDDGRRWIRCTRGADADGTGELAVGQGDAAVDFLLGGLLPFPGDSWKGRVDEAGVLHALLGTEDHWIGGSEATFDGHGLPVSAVTLVPGKDGVLRPETRAEIRWEPAGKRFRLVDVTLTGKRGVLLRCVYTWGPDEEFLPRRWTVLLHDRVSWIRRAGEEAHPGVDLDPLMTYFLDPKPEEFLARIVAYDSGLLPDEKKASDAGDLHAVALSAILRAEPSRFPAALKELAGAGPGPGRVLLRAIAYAGGPSMGDRFDAAAPLVHESLREDLKALRAGLPHPLESPVPMNDHLKGAGALDRCWLLYFVSGDPAALRPIIGALRGLDTAVPGKVMTGEVVGGAARWSLVSNARRIPAVRECLERDLSMVPEELRPRLEEVLAKAAATPGPETEGKEKGESEPGGEPESGK